MASSTGPAQLVSETVVQFEQQRRDAMASGDIDTLGDLLSPQLIYGHSTGIADSKESYLEKLRTGAVAYHELSLDVTDIIHLEQAAIVHGVMRAQVRLQNRAVDIHNRFMTVWRLEQSRWRLVAHQTVALPQA